MPRETHALYVRLPKTLYAAVEAHSRSHGYPSSAELVRELLRAVCAAELAVELQAPDPRQMGLRIRGGR